MPLVTRVYDILWRLADKLAHTWPMSILTIRELMVPEQNLVQHDRFHGVK